MKEIVFCIAIATSFSALADNGADNGADRPRFEKSAWSAGEGAAAVTGGSASFGTGGAVTEAFADSEQGGLVFTAGCSECGNIEGGQKTWNKAAGGSRTETFGNGFGASVFGAGSAGTAGTFGSFKGW